MTSPEGDTFHGWWRITAVEPTESLDLTDGFADQSGAPNDAMPTTDMSMRLFDKDGGTRMELRSVFHTREEMEKLAEMGMDEGLREAVGQMDDCSRADRPAVGQHHPQAASVVEDVPAGAPRLPRGCGRRNPRFRPSGRR